MNITKGIAEEIATKLLIEKQNELDEQNKTLKEFVKNIIRSRIPAEIDALWGRFPNWINSTYYFYITGEGMNHTQMNLGGEIPFGASNTIQFTPEQAREYTAHQNKLDNLKKEYDALYQEIVTALVGLRTYNRIQESFPEAYALLPADRKSTALVVNINKLRCTLNAEAC